MATKKGKNGEGNDWKQSAALRLSRINYILLACGAVSVAIGYVLLARGSTVAAPLLLVLGYAVLLPLGIIK